MKDRSKFTLYSGGHRGAESKFGELAEKWGIAEVNYSFDGHNIQRASGVRVLDEVELSKGNVSMEIVSARMGRTYTSSSKIRKVTQLIFHMVNSGYHVIAVGWIQPDGTVKGGTGWGVELAKLFNRPLHVFDQDRNTWFAWKNHEWVVETPTITSDSFAGTGTRNLSKSGEAALLDLFERSFGDSAKA
ncbi:MAG: hypothetical protein JSU96_10585 [Acidobacteriota bacterium]|nr:MAG: hypothetical protein JSU96_10585 [Acidobacteriota bacterium]